MGSQMRPNNFRHDKRGSRVVEIRMEEYERSKRSILKTIRFRLIVLGMLMALLAIVAITLGAVIRSYHMKIVKFQRTSLGVRLRDLYFVYAAVAVAFGLHGLYMDGKWERLQHDGNHLVLHVRLYSLLGLGAWGVALWLGTATLAAFGFVEIAYITSSSPNLIYLSTLVAVCLHLLIVPWLLRTIHRKGSQADEYYGAEFMAELQRPSQRAAISRGESGDNGDDHDDHDDEDARRDGTGSDDSDGGGSRARVAPAKSPRRRSSTSKSRHRDGGQKSRKAFYNADGTATVLMPVAAGSGTGVDGSAAPAAVVVQEALLTSSRASNPEQIPFASPVFVLDHEPRLTPSDFWRLWKASETTGSFSCIFTNAPTQHEVEAHLRAFGFHVVTSDVREAALQTYFYATPLGATAAADNAAFLCEFVLIFARRFFQATFKCQEREAAVDFVTRFNLQELLTVEHK